MEQENKYPMPINSVQVMQVIVSTKELRGDGKNIPFRRITQVYTLDGVLIAENDPFDGEEMQTYHEQ